MEATARPWKIGPSHTNDWAIRETSPDNECVAITVEVSPFEAAKANAELIVRAVNSHDQVVEALKLAAKYVNKMVADDVKMAIPPANALRVIELAIRQAEGK